MQDEQIQKNEVPDEPIQNDYQMPPMSNEPIILPWEQQKGEPDKLFVLFEVYRDLSYMRTFAKIARICGRSYPTILNYAKSWNWKKRSALWDEASFEHLKKKVTDSVIPLNDKKLQNKISISANIQDMIQIVQPYLKNFHSHFNSYDTKQKLKFIKNVAAMLVQMNKSIDFSVDDVLNEKRKSDTDALKMFLNREEIDYSFSGHKKSEQDINEITINALEKQVLPNTIV